MTVHVYVYENTMTTLWFESLVICEGGPWKLVREYDKEIPDPVGPGGATDYEQLINRPKINSVLLSGDKTSKQLNILDTNYAMANDSGSGNVVQVGSIDIYGTKYGVYEFFYNTPKLPNATTIIYEFGALLADYTIYSFIEAVGVTDSGIHIGSGRTDGTTQIVVQQFSKNNKSMTIRTYQDYSKSRSVMRIQFIGTKTA